MAVGVTDPSADIHEWISRMLGGMKVEECLDDLLSLEKK